MKISNRVHKGTAITAAIIMLVTLVSGIFTNVITMVMNQNLHDIAPATTMIVNLVINSIVEILVIVALFRGKKDIMAAIFFLVITLAMVITGVIGRITNIITLLRIGDIGNDSMVKRMITGGMIALVANLAAVGFRVLLALECFKPGKISGCGAKALLIILPLVNILLVAASSIAQQGYMMERYGFAEFFLIAGLPAVLAAVFSIGWILAGAAFAKPVYEQLPVETPYTAQENEIVY